MSIQSYNYNDTVYIRNINEKVGINTIKSQLTNLFNEFGPIISITAHKNIKMRGQAFVVLDSSEKAKSAINKLDGFELFQQKLQVELAKSSSNSSVEKQLSKDQYEKYLNERKEFKIKEDEKKQSAPKKVKLDNTPPNKILLLQDLPADVSKDELLKIFSKYSGFVEVRLVAVRRVAFVEFENDEDAIPAKEENKNLVIRTSKPSVNFAKK